MERKVVLSPHPQVIASALERAPTYSEKGLSEFA